MAIDTLRWTLSALLLVASGCANEVEGENDSSNQAGLEADEACDVDTVRSCAQQIDPEAEGLQVCYASERGGRWSECQPYYPQNGPEDCSEYATWNGDCCMNDFGCCEDDIMCNTPLVLAFDSEPVSYVTHMQGAFDLTGRGASLATDWPTARTPWLALDRDGNGRIDDGGELFGSATRLATGSFAGQGFEALAELDDNRDGFITEADGAFAQLLLWADADASRTSQASELTPAPVRLVAIELGYRIARRCDARGNCEVQRARFWYRDPTGATREGSIIDVHLASQ